MMCQRLIKILVILALILVVDPFGGILCKCGFALNKLALPFS